MFNRLAALIKKEFTLGFKNSFTAVVIASAIMLVLINLFVIPADLSTDVKVYLAADGQTSNMLRNLAMEKDKENILASREEIVSKMEDNISSIGVYFYMEEKVPVVELIMQGYESQSMINMYMLSTKTRFEQQLLEQTGGSIPATIKTVQLKDYKEQPLIPFNDYMIPLFLVFESTLVGLVMVATMVFSEKEERTHLAYAVTPGRISEFLLSKLIFMALLGVLSSIIITIPTLGFVDNIGYILLLVFLGNLFGSTMGLLIGAFFDSLSKSMVWIMILSMIISAPMISYFMPVFSPFWLQLFPTYPLLFALKEGAFPSGNPSIIYNTLLLFVLLDIVMISLTNLIYRRRLTR